MSSWLDDSWFSELRDKAESRGLRIKSVFTAHRELGGFFCGDPRKRHDGGQTWMVLISDQDSAAKIRSEMPLTRSAPAGTQALAGRDNLGGNRLRMGLGGRLVRVPPVQEFHPLPIAEQDISIGVESGSADRQRVAQMFHGQPLQPIVVAPAAMGRRDEAIRAGWVHVSGVSLTPTEP